MKVVIYTLNADGTIPDYIVDGGYFACANDNASPQDLDLIGLATEDTEQPNFENKTKLLEYVKSKNLIFKNSLTKQLDSSEIVVENFWNQIFE